MTYRRPDTSYVRVDGADVAYQVMGDGPVDLVYFYGVGSHIELFWDDPVFAEMFRRLASFSRLILFDRRGTGSSDRVEQAAPTWEQSTDDLRAVLDAVGSTGAAIFGDVDAGPIAIQFAAMQPERVRALILSNSSARFMWAPDYPIGFPEAEADARLDAVEAAWGTTALFALSSPGRAEEPGWAELMARNNRAALTPRAAGALLRYLIKTLDVRDALPLVQAPTLVVHNVGNVLVPLSHGRFLAEHIPGARMVEFDTADLTWNAATMPRIVAEVAELVTGEPGVADPDRVLATILFTDIVGSTELAARVGDTRWHALLDAHDQATRGLLRRFSGREIKTTGDGFVASFEGPARAVRCATAILEATRDLGVVVRAGIHTGECDVRGDDLGGMAVHIAAPVAALAGADEVLVSGTVKDLVVGSGIHFEDRGAHDLKGVPGRWATFAVRP